MQTVQFICGHFGKLMAVGSDYLGKQVRCPHCQQVVFAPVTSEPPPQELPETVVQQPPPAEDPEDIFSPPEPSDDLFGQPQPPRVELPPDPFAATVATQNTLKPPQPDPAVSATLPYAPTEERATRDEDKTAILSTGHEESSWMSGSLTETLPASISEPPPPFAGEPTAPLFQDAPPASSPTPVRSVRPSGAKVPWFLILVFIPLLLYSIVISIFAFRLYQIEQEKEQQIRNRFEIMPDEGDKPGVEKGKKITRYQYDPKIPTLPLPEHLCTTLGNTLTIGDLQVTPRRVERRRVQVVVEKFQPEPCLGDSLVMYLDMKNISSVYSFAPLDNYFDRHWRQGQDPLPPFTLLEVGAKQRFYGGPASWFPRGDTKNRRQWVKGRRDQPDVLSPGAQKEFFVCTDGNDAKAVAVLFGENAKESYHGAFLWRVRVRRGLVRIGEKDYSATAVIGVRFNDKDIGGAQQQAQ